MAETSPPNLYATAQETWTSLSRSIPETLKRPIIAIICGSGLGGLAGSIRSEPRYEIPYEDLPNFPRSTGKLPTPESPTPSLQYEALRKIRVLWGWVLTMLV